MSTTPEGKVKEALRKQCKELGLYLKNIPQNGFGSSAGLPDYIAITNEGKHIWIEVKSPTGKLSPLQKIVKDDLLQRNCNYILYRGNPEDKEVLENMSH
jgi:Holliday junction resolvase